MNTLPFVKVIGIPLYVGTISVAQEHLLKIEDRKNRLVSATGAHGLVYSKTHEEFRNVLQSFYLNLPDGMPGVWVGKLKGSHGMDRCYGPDFFKTVMHRSSLSTRHFLCGGNEGVADKLKVVCEDKFEANIVGTYCPPFLPVDKYNYTEVATIINSTNADIIWIGLSTPKQEMFAYNLSKFTQCNFICCVGAAFDFHIGNVRQAPKWIQNIGLEWFFRLSMEPKRLWKRYIEIVPKFIFYNFAELFRGKFFNKKK